MMPPWTRDTPFGKPSNNWLVCDSCLCTPWVPCVVFTTCEARGWRYIFFDMHCQCCSSRDLKSVFINDKATIAHGHAGIIMEWNSDAKIKEFKISHCRAYAWRLHRPQPLARTACPTTRAHVHHVIVLHSCLDASKKILQRATIICLIISVDSVVLEDMQKHFRYGPPRSKACHEENVSRLKFSQMLFKFGRRVSKPWWCLPLEKKCWFLAFVAFLIFGGWGGFKNDPEP